MHWWFSCGWLCRAWEKRRKHRPTRRWVRYIHPHLERLEKRQLLDNNVWLPQQLYAFDGTTQTLVATSLFRPATTTLLTQLGLQNTTISATGSVSLTDSGVYSLSLSQSGPYDSNGDRYTFSESGTVSFALSESGTFSATGFSITSVTLTQTASLSWSFAETNSSGQTVQNLSGSNTTVSVSNGAAPFDPFFPQGFNWLTPTLKISSLNSLSLANLTASSLTINETNGSENYTFQLTNAVATVQGNVRQPLSDSLLQTGQNSYTETATESFNSTNTGSDSFSLTELGSYSNNSYSLSSIAYSEQSGTQSTQFNATVIDSQSGTGTESGVQAFSGNNHSLGNSSSESFQLNNLSTLNYGENATSNFSMSQQGSYGGGSFSLGSLTYNPSNGSGGYSLTQTSLETQNGTFSDSSNASGLDSFGISGSMSSSGTVTASGNFTSTQSGTLHDNESGSFMLSEAGGYGNGSWSLSSYSLNESLSGGSYSQQQLDTTTKSGNSTLTSSGTGTDSFILKFLGLVTTSGGDTVNSIDTQMDSFTLTSTNSSTYSGNSSYTLNLTGSLQGGVPALGSYLFQSGQSGTYSASGGGNETDNGSAQDSASGSDNGNESAGLTNVLKSILNNDSFSASDSFSFTSIDSSSSSDGGSFTQSTYQAGIYSNSSFALSSVVETSTGNDTSSLLTDNDSATDSGNDTETDSGNGQGNETDPIGDGTFTDLNSGTYSDSDNGTFNDGANDTTISLSSSAFSLTKLGIYSNYSFSFNTVTYTANGTSNNTVQESDNDSFTDSIDDNYSGSGNDTANGSYAIAIESVLASVIDSGSDSFSSNGNDTITETINSNDSWNIYALGSFVGGSWSLSSVSAGDSYSDSYSSQTNDSATDAGTDTTNASDTTTSGDTVVSGGGSMTGTDTVTGSDNANASFTNPNNATVTASGIDTYLLTQSGTYGGESFAFSSWVYQGGDSVTETTNESDPGTYNGAQTDSSGDNGGDNGLGTYSANTDNDTASLNDSGSDSFTTGGSSSFSQTISSTHSSSFYEAGVLSGGSLSLNSVVFNSSGRDTWSYTGSDTNTDNGPETLNDSSGGNAVFQLLKTAASNGGDFGSFNLSLTQNGTDTSTSTDSYSGGGNDCWSLSKQGTFGNFSYSFGSYLYQENGNESETVNETSTNSFNGSLTDNSGDGGNDNSNDLYGILSFALQNLDTATANASGSETVISHSYATTTSSDTWSDYEAGNFSGNSLSLSSINSSDTGSDSWSDSGNDSSTSVGPQTLNAGVTLTANATVNGANSMSLNNLTTFTANGTVNGTDTFQSYDSYSDSGGDTWSTSEQGVYNNDSYSMGTVIEQGGGTYSGTYQANTTDTFYGSSTDSSGDSVQVNDNGLPCFNMNAGNEDAQSSFSYNATQTVSNNAYSSMTQTDNGSYSYYQSGSFAGDSYSFGNVSNSEGGSDSFTSIESTNDNDTFSGSDTVGDSASGDDGVSEGDDSNAENNAASAIDSGSFSGNQTVTSLVTTSGGDNYSVTALGSFANDSYAYSSYVYTANDSQNSNSQETDTSSGTWPSTGTLSDSGLQNANANVTVNVGGDAITDAAASDDASSLDSGSYSGTVNSTDTTTTTQVGTFSESLYQAGIYTAGSYAYTSVVYNQSSTSSSTSQQNDTFTSTDTRSGNDSTSNSHQDNGPGINNQSAANSAVYTAQDTTNASDTFIDSSIYTLTLYEAGSYSNESYSLNSFVLLEQSSETRTELAISNASSTESGSTSGNEAIPGANFYSGSGTFIDNSGSNATVQETNTDSWGLSEQGTFGGGSLSISSYVFTEQQSSSASLSQSGNWTETLSGTNESQSYSGGNNGSFSDSYNIISAGTLLEQGSYGNGSFNLSLFSYSGSGNDSSSANESDNSSWSGGYSGSETANASESGNGNWNLSLLGSYSGGSFSLSSDVLQGSSSGNYNNSESNEESLVGSGGGSYSGGNSPLTSSYDRNASGGETDSFYQSGQITAGVYSNLSYNVSSGESDEITTSSGAGSYSGSDTWDDSNGLSVTGSGSSGSEVETSSSTYSWLDYPNSSPPPVTGLGTSAWQTTMSATLPEGVIPPLPDGTSVPEDGAEDSDGMVPVAALPALSLAGVMSEWMSSQGWYANQVTNNGVDFAASEVPQANQAFDNPVAAPNGRLATSDTGMDNLTYVQTSDVGTEILMPFNPASDPPSIQLMGGGITGGEDKIKSVSVSKVFKMPKNGDQVTAQQLIAIGRQFYKDYGDSAVLKYDSTMSTADFAFIKYGVDLAQIQASRRDGVVLTRGYTDEFGTHTSFCMSCHDLGDQGAQLKYLAAANRTDVGLAKLGSELFTMFALPGLARGIGEGAAAAEVASRAASAAQTAQVIEGEGFVLVGEGRLSIQLGNGLTASSQTEARQLIGQLRILKGGRLLAAPTAPITNEAGLARTGQIRNALDVGKGRTAAFAEVDVTGLKGEVVGVSGAAERGGLAARFEKANPGASVAGNTVRTGPGALDAEVKILDNLRGKLDSSASGTIRLFVDQPELKGVCENCTKAILQFRKDFPNIKLIVSSP